MKQQYRKAFVIILPVLTCFIAIIITGCNIGAGTDPYSERYEFNISSDRLITRIQKFKYENPEYLVPRNDLLDHYDNNSTVTRYYHIYLYYKKENQILHLWIANDIENQSKSYLNFVAINDGLELGNWKKINEDYTKSENKKLINQFDERVLKKLQLSYKNKGNSMSLF